jgi:hypothetical protein
MRPRGKPPVPSAASSEMEPGRNDGDRNDGVLRSQAQDRALAELLLDLAEGLF